MRNRSNTLRSGWPLLFAILGVSALALTPQVRFIDIGPAAGLTAVNVYGGSERKDYILETTGNGLAIFDFDGDGDNDLLVANGTTLQPSASQGRNTLHVYQNDGKARFTEMGRKVGFTVEGWAQGLCTGDYDNDGWTDVLVTYYGHNRLYHNQKGTFREMTGDAGLPTSGTRYGSGCTFLDFDRDGFLDLFVANYVDLDLSRTPKPGSSDACQWKGLAVMCGPQGLPKASNVLYRNQRDGTFADVSEKAGILKPGGRYGLGAVAADFDADGWPDIYVACDMTPSLLYRNRQDGTFEERGVAAGVAYNVNGQLQAGMGVAVGDYDGDGRLDIGKSNFSGDLPSLFRNEDGGFFTDVAREVGLGTKQLLGWGIAFVDVDDDGRPDLVIANGHVYPEVDRSQVGDRYLQETLLYRNTGDGRFAEITSAAGPGFAMSRPARGLAVGDLDGDGRPEIAIANMNARPSLLKNEVAGGHFLNLKLVGTQSNRSAIGARVRVHAGGRTQVQEVLSASSYYSSHEPALHFGLGLAETAEWVEVRWPHGETQRWNKVQADRTVFLREGKTEIE